MQTNAQEQAALQNEWARAQGMGRRLQKQRMIATLAGMAVVFGGFLAAILLYVMWPLHKIPVMLLIAPIAASIGLGWTLRNKLWPKGQFA